METPDACPDGKAVDPEFLRQLLPTLAQLGIELPGVGRIAPTVDCEQPIGSLALELGRLCAAHNLYLFGEAVVTVDALTGKVAKMNNLRFSAWVEQWTAFKTGPRARRQSLSVDDALQILSTDAFRGCLRPLTAVHLMRLPVRRKAGEIAFLPLGYDRESGIFTAKALEYEMDWPVERALKFLDDHGAEYPFVFDDRRGDLSKNRSWAVQVAAMLGVYCKALFEPGTPRPMILYLGNKPGTGKSTLAAMALMPVFGTAATTAIPKDADRMVSTLETIARTRRPYVFFDDVGHGIFNNSLYQFILSRSHAGRVLGANAEFFEEQNVTQVFVSGNDIKFDGNLKRRALVVELFLEQDVRGRKFQRVINTDYLARPCTRAGFLSAMCAIVRDYVAQRPALTDGHLEMVQPLESFEEWSAVIALMVRLVGYADPLATPDLLSGGAVEEDECRELLVRIASDAERGRVFTLNEMVDLAREHGLLADVAGSKGDPSLDAGATKKWGRMIRKHRAQTYIDKRGRWFQFGRKKQKTGASYPLTFLPDPEGGPELEPALVAAGVLQNEEG